MSQNSKWSSWQQLKPTKQKTIIIEAPETTTSLTVEPTVLVTEPVEEIMPVEEPINETATTEEVAAKPIKKRNVNV